MVERFVTISFTKPVPSSLLEFIRGIDGRVLGISESSLSEGNRVLVMETTADIREVIQFIAPLVDVVTIGLMKEETHYEPEWINLLR